ncbi:zona pellucida sperm-binding protein 3-like [Hyla sarda]|uniref:zona pellucida sperm-binding protein 3-like n=1 Tax=Hyla sarda TaxID=327740 RepID=UPI0024C464DA|nr:zona pellucida sperm-binding protein 3-like [Hyla sarda]
MELWIRWSCLLVVLLYGSGFSSALGRHRRQSNTWRSNQPEWGSPRRLGQSASGLGSSRSNPWSQTGSVSGVGSARGFLPVSGWGPGFGRGDYQSRQLPPQSSSSPISVQCNEDSMVVTVKRDFYGNGKLVKPSDLSLGSCPPGAQTTDPVVVFQNDLQDCGNILEMTPDLLIYNSALRYTPTTSSNVPIIRSNSAVVPIQCLYPRHGNVSSNAIKPTWIPFSTTVTSEERLAFSFRLMTADWSAPSPSLVFQLGDMFYIEASLETQNHAPMILFVDSCVATITPDVASTPRYEIISNYGCLVDGTEEDSSSVFVSPRPQADKLRFMVDAFRFNNNAASLIYITCSLRAAAINKTPDPVNKACSYNKASSSWSPVEGPSGICQCCTTGNCATAGGQRSAWGSSLGRERRPWKRDVGSHVEEHVLATLGPLLLVTGAEPNQMSRAGTAQASRMSAGHGPLQLWVLVAVGSVTSVVVAVALTVAVKCLLRRFSDKESV